MQIPRTRFTSIFVLVTDALTASVSLGPPESNSYGIDLTTCDELNQFRRTKRSEHQQYGKPPQEILHIIMQIGCLVMVCGEQARPETLVSGAQCFQLHRQALGRQLKRLL